MSACSISNHSIRKKGGGREHGREKSLAVYYGTYERSRVK